MIDPESDNPDNTRPDTLEAAQARIDKLEQRLAAESELRERAQNNERCFRELAEHIREVFWMTNPLGDQLVYISPAYEQIWGQTCQSLYEDPGKRLAWVHDADREEVLTAFKRDAADGNYDKTFRIDRPDGETRWIRDRAFPVYDDDGELYRLAGFALDITDRINFNDRISQLHTSIDTRDRISVFAALGTGLAHDLSQPLTAARNFIARARMGFTAEGSEIRGTLERADHEISRAVSVIHHLRDFARQGKPTRNKQAVQPIIDDVHQLLDPALRANNVRYHGPALDSIESLELPIDEIFVQQILRNLVTNAVDAFSDGEQNNELREVHVRVNSANDDYVDIEVVDNGPGVADDIQVFEPFLTTKDDGVGLGLAVCRTLARSHGGDLILSDRGRAANSGDCDARTIFSLRLPRN
ncbi:multi-sensor signal transduction histidine kinase [Salinisphaera dokdonensis CL-ES53]|uniref:histidine kinase n=1 Tax=Salinisphaera dokdonensis CL-ES53 TaxID=1304272 RepID=A0ABV2B1Y1_9GAMM